VIENKRIVDLRLNGRSAFSLAGLVPAINPTGGGATPHISGSQTSTSEVQIDGAIDISPGAIGGLNRRVYEPQVDSVEEFSVQVNGLDAEYGRFAGGVINVMTKSGTNQIHGSAYEFLRNSKLDANNFFANRAGRPKSDFKRNQFGGTVGGPVWIPGVYRGVDETFFFAGYEKAIARSQAVFTTPVAVNMLKYFPAPNAAPVNPTRTDRITSEMVWRRASLIASIPAWTTTGAPLGECSGAFPGAKRTASSSIRLAVSRCREMEAGLRAQA
jgi:hypothetical protein